MAPVGRYMSHRTPGHGEQYDPIASAPNVDDGLPCSKQLNGTLWKVGHDYIDTEVGDVCELVEIRKKSSWCERREDGHMELVFKYERAGGQDSTITQKPNSLYFDEDRFIERYTEEPPLGAPPAPW